MDFKSPLFFLALLCLAIPIIIHLFNLRKYKKMYFPSLRMLESMMVKNQKMSRIQKWLLLVSRLLAVFFLVLAFTQPFLSTQSLNQKEGIKVLYFDNSMSTTYQIGQSSILDDMKKHTIDWLKSENIDELIILTNTDLNNLTAYNADHAIHYIEKINTSPFSYTLDDVYNAIEHIKNVRESDIHVILVTDHQKHFFQSKHEGKRKDQGIQFYNLFSPSTEFSNNIYIDTTYVIASESGNENDITVITDIKRTGKELESIDLQYNINGQNFASKNIAFSENDTILVDTQNISIQSQIDNNIHVHFQSKNLGFDDNYYLSIKTSSQLKVAIINTDGINNQLTQAFNASKKIFPEQLNSLSELENKEQYSLIMMNNIKSIDNSDIDIIKSLLDKGACIGVSIGKNANISRLNDAFKSIAGISIHDIDTVTQFIAQIENQHPLLKDVILKQPDNLQLPTVSYRFLYSAPLSSRPQDVMKMRDGSGLITQYSIGKGTLYLIGTPIDLNSNNITQSYYFAPLMYKMATNNAQKQIQSYEISQGQMINIYGDFDENTVLNLEQNELRSIPVQKKITNGIVMTVPELIVNDGVYNIKNQSDQKIRTVSLNYNRDESQMDRISFDELKSVIDIQPLTFESSTGITQHSIWNDIWKWIIIFTLLAIIFETILLIKKDKP